MNPSKTFTTGPWSTAAFAPESGSAEPAANSGLGEHLIACLRLRGPLFALRCSADALRSFVGAHLVTSFLVLLLAGGLLALCLL